MFTKTFQDYVIYLSTYLKFVIMSGYFHIDVIQSKNRKAPSDRKGKQHLFLRYLTLVKIAALKIINFPFLLKFSKPCIK